MSKVLFMIDFSNTYEAFNKYKGKEVKKTLIYNNIGYLVKFPDPVKDKKDKIFYNNNVFSEYIGSNIFKICGFNTQNTILGEYKINDKTKIVCACEDFTDNNHNLYDFENLAISVNTDKKIDTELSDIMDILDSSKNIIDVNNTKQLFLGHVYYR